MISSYIWNNQISLCSFRVLGWQVCNLRDGLGFLILYLKTANLSLLQLKVKYKDQALYIFKLQTQNRCSVVKRQASSLVLCG